MDERPRFIAFSGGVESTTLALMYGHVATPIWADTGWEHRPLYERIDTVEEALREVHGEDFRIERIRRAHPTEPNTLPEYIDQYKFLPSGVARYCTRKFKIEPIDDFLRQFDPENGGPGAELMIGLNADEAEQRTGNHGLLPFVTYSYPLVDLGITREHCEAVLNKRGLHPEFPAYMARGGCRGCFFKSKREFAALALLDPEEFEGLIELEESIQDRRERYFKIRDDMPPLRQFRDQVEASLFSPEEMYPHSVRATACGVFCHR